jgi:hypothetical protein
MKKFFFLLTYYLKLGHKKIPIRIKHIIGTNEQFEIDKNVQLDNELNLFSIFNELNALDVRVDNLLTVKINKKYVRLYFSVF